MTGYRQLPCVRAPVFPQSLWLFLDKICAANLPEDAACGASLSKQAATY